MAAKQPKAPPAPSHVPVRVDNFTRRSDDDALEGHWVDVVGGDHAGRRGAFEQVLENDPKTGYPSKILVRSRDARNEALVIDYADARPTEYTGGR